MWNRLLERVFSRVSKETQKENYEKYKKSLEHIVKELTRVLEADDAIEIIVYGECFRKAFEKKE